MVIVCVVPYLLQFISKQGKGYVCSVLLVCLFVCRFILSLLQDEIGYFWLSKDHNYLVFRNLFYLMFYVFLDIYNFSPSLQMQFKRSAGAVEVNAHTFIQVKAAKWPLLLLLLQGGLNKKCWMKNCKWGVDIVVIFSFSLMEIVNFSNVLFWPPCMISIFPQSLPFYKKKSVKVCEMPFKRMQTFPTFF